MDIATAYCNPEIWGGIECTINRVNDKFIDQLHHSGHYYREDDIRKIASLGIRRLRYPILWEKHQPGKTGSIDWRWIEKQLTKIRENNIDVIAGLLHHGSGPEFTNLLDPEFPNLLAVYAGKVAEKFPWIEYYTPVNEPLTTARFSGLYGTWYPHASDAKSFIRMLLNQLKGVVLSMQEIRKINPNAKLVQTEDLGKTYSTETLQYQAGFENERRWLTYDILCGKFNEQHALWNYFQFLEIDNQQLDFFLDNPCPPDVFGFNYYLTSERYLDERLERYPRTTHGGNGRHQYADVEAARVNTEEETGIEVLVKEAWERYHGPIAITEVHLHCHREEQMRWFKYILRATSKLKGEGVDIIAITSWALLGSYGWNKLLREPGGDYEPGAFDLGGGYLRPTALAKYIEQTAADPNHDHHLSEEKGWWEREARLIYETCHLAIPMITKQNAPVLIMGKNGTLGKAFAHVCEERRIHHYLLSRQDCDISNPGEIEAVIEQYRPWAIINAAGYVRVDDAENDSVACIRDNTTGPHHLSIACNKHGIQLLSFSSDLVFDGNKPTPYIESDLPHPLNVYGKSKAQSELIIQKYCPSALIIRTSAFFSPWDEHNFAHYVQQKLLQNERVTVAKDLFVTPTYVPHLVHAALDILIDGESGIWHLTNKGGTSWSEWAYKIADGLHLDSSLIDPVWADQIGYEAKRPHNSELASERGNLLPSFELAMNEYLEYCKRGNKKVA